MGIVREYILKVAKEEIEKIAKEIFDECVDLSDEVITQFYAAYHPDRYERMYSFYGVCSPYMKPWKKVNGFPSYEVGINVLQGVAGGHKDPDEYVFHGVMDLGYHGTSQIAISTPPMTLLESYFNKFR